ncbi:MAG: FimB/Mfa2 family fimbrial subunit [Bacteroidales bacterium]|nr:FimB/Mfa2 family fimbrial subunit [Bacteroidales bacterium]
MAAAFTLMLLLASCLKEDLADCPEQIRIYFAPETRAGDESNTAGIDRLHLYVFCEQGYFQAEYRDDNITAFGSDYYIDCSNLLPGKYRFVAWGGKDDGSYSVTPAPFVKGETTFDEAVLTLRRTGNTAAAVQRHLFHAGLTATVTYDRTQRFDMPLTQLSNTVSIRTAGLPAGDNSYTLRITDSNGSYKFDRSPASGDAFTYAAPCTRDAASQLSASLNVLQLSADRPVPRLEIYNETAGSLLYPAGNQTGNLVELIQGAYPQNDFNTVHTYDIVITFTPAVTVSVNGWVVYSQDSELL